MTETVLWGLLLYGGALAIAAARAILGWLQVRRDADEEWSAYRTTWPHLAEGLDLERYRDAYVRAHAPRASIYAAAVFVIAGLATPLALGLLATLWRFLRQAALSGFDATQDPVLAAIVKHSEEGLLVWQFYLFFGVVAFWVIAIALVVRRYHARRPGSFDVELERVRA